MRIKPVLAFAFLFTVFVSPAAFAGDEHVLEIEKADGESHRLSTELVITADKQRRGLMYRTELAKDAGMLFFYQSCELASFWMKNTYIPLDMIFIEADGRIANITHEAQPETLDIHESGVPVNGVLEVNGGLTQRLGIAEGDYVRHPWFGEGGKATCD
jgi:uncharacterized protein